MKRIIVFVTGIFLIICIGAVSFRLYQYFKQDRKFANYENSEYHISLKYNKEWKQNNAYDNRFEGEDGFFQVTAFNGKDWSIDEVAEHEAEHKLKPYGSSPQISQWVIDGQEARLIIPSEDQVIEFNNQAEVIIKYPKVLKINGNQYYFFIMYADKNNIQSIAKTIKFID